MPANSRASSAILSHRPRVRGGDYEAGERSGSSLWSPATDAPALSVWNEPFGDLGLSRGRNPLARLFGDLSDERRLAGLRWSPAVDVARNDNSYAITVELPGAEREEKDERRHVIERSYGSFSRSFSLPANADAERIAASFKDGVLTIDIPKAQESKPKQVDIKAT